MDIAAAQLGLCSIGDGVVGTAGGGHDAPLPGGDSTMTGTLEDQPVPAIDTEGTDAMFKVTVLYNEPTNPEGFEDYYFDRHLSIAAKIPNVTRVETARAAATPDGSPLPYFRMAEIWFKDLETLQASMGSPEGQATVADLANFATSGADVFIAAVD